MWEQGPFGVETGRRTNVPVRSCRPSVRVSFSSVTSEVRGLEGPRTPLSTSGDYQANINTCPTFFPVLSWTVSRDWSGSPVSCLSPAGLL